MTPEWHRPRSAPDFVWAWLEAPSDSRLWLGLTTDARRVVAEVPSGATSVVVRARTEGLRRAELTARAGRGVGPAATWIHGAELRPRLTDGPTVTVGWVP